MFQIDRQIKRERERGGGELCDMKTVTHKRLPIRMRLQIQKKIDEIYLNM